MTARYILREFAWPLVRATLIVSVIAAIAGVTTGVIEMLNERPRSVVAA